MMTQVARRSQANAEAAGDTVSPDKTAAAGRPGPNGGYTGSRSHESKKTASEDAVFNAAQVV